MIELRQDEMNFEILLARKHKFLLLQLLVADIIVKTNTDFRTNIPPEERLLVILK
jgi:hypothetical protein